MEKTGQDKIIKDAQYRKGLSISYFNSLNSAIALCSGMNIYDEATFKKIEEIRDLFLKNYKNYYATVIANIGQNYNVAESIAKLKEAENLDELKVVWLNFSEDERRDGVIIAEVKKLKAKYEKSK